ncbi:universal stress protein [Saccharopolyspora rhizosphaerae]|uniref:universal stress protein n=1 Tax=Saccharopolyspora rhizosphaerae TaxID=2492662 RepID=UPI001315A1FA|nr:universal stress protein [Saccharopolyspora rhizosphaerae]
MAGNERIVVGVDGSEASRRALRWALREARVRGASVAAVMVWHSQAVLAGPAPLLMNPRLAPHHVREQRWQELTRVVTECSAGLAATDVSAELVEGHADEVLIEKSKDAAMLVLGDHGRGKVADAVLGNTALRCVEHAKCPVLIIPSGVNDAAGAEDAQGAPEEGRRALR